MLELEIKRGSADEALDAIRLVDEVCLWEEDRKVYRIPYTIYHRGGGEGRIGSKQLKNARGMAPHSEIVTCASKITIKIDTVVQTNVDKDRGNRW